MNSKNRQDILASVIEPCRNVSRNQKVDVSLKDGQAKNYSALEVRHCIKNSATKAVITLFL